MPYRPFAEYDYFLWIRATETTYKDPEVLPPELFDHLTGGDFTPADLFFLAHRIYYTEAAAFADLQQAAQALYTSQHRPTQYRNSF
jgi:hypothetical protein